MRKTPPHNFTHHRFIHHRSIHNGTTPNDKKSTLAVSLMLAIVLVMSACSGATTSEVAAGTETGSDGSGQSDPSGQDGIDPPADQDAEPTSQPVADSGWDIVDADADLENRRVTPIEDAIVSDDGTSIEVRFLNGVKPCSGADVAVLELNESVVLRLETGPMPGAEAMTCIAVVEQKAIVVQLQDPLGSRVLTLEQPTDAGDKPLEAQMDPELQQFIGLSLDGAEELAAELGYTTRIARVDGEWFALTEDYIDSRLNFEVENDTIVMLSNW